jgi:hypothetical protein
VHIVRVRTGAGGLGAMFGIAVLFGSHTFAGTVVEGFPINTFLTIVICCLMAVALTTGAHAWWKDVAVSLLLVFAALTVESGLLVCVVVAAAWAVGFRGVSTGAVAVVTALTLGYFILRFAFLDVSGPGLTERSTGFGFAVLNPPELIARFGERPAYLYAYNVVSQMLTVLFAEPKGGTFRLTRDLRNGEWLPRQIIATLASGGATLLIGWYVATRRAALARLSLSDGDRLVIVFVAVLIANAVLSYPYTKDVIVSPAGALFALAAAVAFAAAIERLPAIRSQRVALTVSLVLAMLSGCWTIRLVGLNYALRQKAFINRTDWAEVFGQNRIAGVELQSASEAEMVRRIRDQAIRRRVPPPSFASPNASRYFEEAW